VEDLGSTNGTELSGKKIEGSVPFMPGAVVRIGRTEIELRRGPR
jgi:pSer/pThr/pTyr-binding forkhead associated (FHA) protein